MKDIAQNIMESHEADYFSKSAFIKVSGGDEIDLESDTSAIILVGQLRKYSVNTGGIKEDSVSQTLFLRDMKLASDDSFKFGSSPLKILTTSCALLLTTTPEAL